jgi:hypothetical protein
MKKISKFKSIAYLFLSIITITSCDVSDKKNETDLDKENLKGEVVLTVSNTIYTEEVALPGGIFLQIYNDKGMKTKEFSGVLGKLFILYETIYENERKVLVKKSLDFGGGISKTQVKYLYDLNGKLDSINFNDDGYGKYTYDEVGKLIKEAYTSNTSKTITDYFYSKSKLDSTIITYKEGDKVSYRTVIDGDNVLINKSFDVKTNRDKVLRDMTYYKKNERGDHMEELYTEFNSNGTKIKSTIKKYEYNYDENGNWIQKRQIEKGLLKSTTNRTIVYKGGETSIYMNEIDKIISSLNSSGNKSNNSKQNNENSSSSNQNNYSNQNQQTDTEKRKCSYCNGTGKCKECGKTFRKSFYKGNGSYDGRNESRPGLVMCRDCWGRGHKQIKRTEGGWEPGGDCYVSNCQDGWLYCRICNNYGNGKSPGQCKECDGTGYRN